MSDTLYKISNILFKISNILYNIPYFRISDIKKGIYHISDILHVRKYRYLKALYFIHCIGYLMKHITSLV